MDENEAKTFAREFVVNLSKIDLETLKATMHPKGWPKEHAEIEKIETYLEEVNAIGTPEIYKTKLFSKRKNETDDGVSFIFTYRIMAIYEENLGDWEVIVLQRNMRNSLLKFQALQMRAKPEDFEASKYIKK
jgi:hypothetical protein